MKKHLYILLCAIATVAAFSSCEDEETYAEQKKHESNYISNYLIRKGISVISEAQFHAQGDSTVVARNEYVLFQNSGVYMQIVKKGCGEKLKDGENCRILCRFTEYNINMDSTTVSNANNLTNATREDIMMVTNTSGTFTAQFQSGAMPYYYGNTEVPGGWLVPLTYIRIGRQKTAKDELAHVKLILPHSQGHATATTNVHAYAYDITYQRGL